MKPDLTHLVDGTMDHYAMACLRVRGLVPRIARPYRVKPWQVILCALHRTDQTYIYVVSHFYITPEV